MSPRALEELGAEHDRPEWRAAASFYQDYLDVLAFEHALDYAGLVQRAGDLLDDAAVLAVERSRFAAVFVDEYQDTDPAQERLLQRLAGRAVTWSSSATRTSRSTASAAPRSTGCSASPTGS
jgi:superfamily I DNA/RNA helicase